MKRYSLLIVAGLLLWATGALVVSAEAADATKFAISPDQDLEFVPGSIIVTFSQSYLQTLGGFPPVPLLNDDLRQLGIQSARKLVQSSDYRTLPPFARNTYVLTVPDTQDILATIDQLKLLSFVEAAQPNYIYSLFSDSKSSVADIPDDEDYSQQWGPRKIRAEDAWGITHGDSSIWVAVIDSGITPDHPDLSGKYVMGWDYIGDDDNPEDSFIPRFSMSHGTHVAGIIGAATNNGEGIAGIGWDTPVFIQRVCLNTYGWGGCPTSLLILALIDAVNQPNVYVINMSLGGYNDDPLVKSTIDFAYNNNIIVVAAAGNSNSDDPSYPACYENVIAVAAIDEIGDRYSESNYGDWVDINAPGVNIYSTIQGQTYDFATGTSQAAPFVSGVAALVYATLPEDARISRLVREILLTTAQPGEWDELLGSGTVDAYAAVQAAEFPPVLSLYVWRYTAQEVVSRNSYLLRIREHDCEDIVFERIMYIDPTGYVQIPLSGVTDGYYDIFLYNSPFLSRELDNVHLERGQETAADFSSQGCYGEFTGDYAVNADDFDIMQKNYYPYSQDYHWELDLNGDGRLNYIDFDAFARCRGLTGGDTYSHTLETDVINPVGLLDFEELNGTSTSTVSFNPSSGTFAVGSEFDVQIVLNTGGATIDGTNFIIRYDACALNVVSITNGSLFGVTAPIYRIDPQKGEITFDNGGIGQSFTGSGVLMTVRFRANASITTAGVWIYFKEGATVDSNMIDLTSGDDILENVGHAMFSITGVPQREAFVATVFPGSNAIVTEYELAVGLTVGGCSSVIVDSVSFEAFYDDEWHMLFDDRNNRNGWNVDWSTIGIADQLITLRANIMDINQQSHTIESEDIALDRKSPNTELALPATIPITGSLNIIWQSEDNLTGVQLVEIQYRTLSSDWQTLITSSNAIGWYAFQADHNEIYAFRVRAQDNAGNWSTFGREFYVAEAVIFLPMVSR